VASALAFGAVLLGATVISCAGGFPRRLSPLALRYAAAAVPDPRYIHELAPQDIPARMVHYGPPAAPVALLVWGDSYAMAALPAIEDLCAKRGVHAVAATRSSTPPIVGFSTAVEGPRRREDIGFNDAVLRHVREEGIGSVLLVGNWSRYVDERETRSRLAGTIDDVRQAGARAYVMREIPGFPFEVPRALVRYTLGGRDPAELALPAADRERAERLHASLSAELGAHGAVIVDPVPYLRAGGDPGRILPFDEEGALFRDAGHLSTHGAIRIAPAFESMFDAIARR
jgi:hypothetical protein